MKSVDRFSTRKSFYEVDFTRKIKLGFQGFVIFAFFWEIRFAKLFSWTAVYDAPIVTAYFVRWTKALKIAFDCLNQNRKLTFSSKKKNLKNKRSRLMFSNAQNLGFLDWKIRNCIWNRDFGFSYKAWNPKTDFAFGLKKKKKIQI